MSTQIFGKGSFLGQPVLGLEYFTLDVFTNQRFGGNPLAVVMDADRLDDALMLQIAAEFNLSETVFVCKAREAENDAWLRIFTPTRELPFAGHPVLGAAMLVGELGSDMSRDLRKTVRLDVSVGVVSVLVSRRAGGGVYCQLDAAKLPVKVGKVPDDQVIADALGIDVARIGYGLHRACRYDAGNAPLFVPVEARAVLAHINVDQSAWQSLEKAGEFGIYAYCRGPVDSNRFHSRFFGPEHTIVEDPATGSAAVAFAGALNEALMLEDGTHRWQVMQGEDMGRPSQIDLVAQVDRGLLKSVKVGGGCVRVSRGVISL
jgi:trans-2,3-dihydro-3-hydroxyanthranilate isomerase